MMEAYLTQVPGGVWRCRPKEITQQDIRRRVIPLVAGSKKNRALATEALSLLGAPCLSRLDPEHYETFYKFLLTLE